MSLAAKFHLCEIARSESKESSYIRLEGWKYFRSFHIANIADSKTHTIDATGSFRIRIGKIDASGRSRWSKNMDSYMLISEVWRGWNTPTPSWTGISSVYVNKGWAVQISYRYKAMARWSNIITLRND